MKIWCVTLVVIIFLGAFGCAPTRKVTTDRTLALSEVIKRVKERNDKIETVSGKGTITIESTEESTNGSFSVNMKKPDSLRMELRGPFGVRIATLMLSRQRFLFYNWVENTAIAGKPDGKTLKNLLCLRMQFDQILNAFTGEISETDIQDSIKQFSVENNLYVLRYSSDEVTKEFWIDGDTFIVTDYLVTDNQGKPILVAHASDVENEEEIPMPKFLRVIFPKERQSITIAYDDIMLNQAIVCSFVVPKQAEVINR